MTVNAAPSRNTYTGNGVTTNFAFGFRILQAADLLVTVDGVTVSNYTVSGVRAINGGTVTFSVPPGVGAVVIIRRAMQLRRSADYQFSGDLPSDTLNDDQDAPVMMIQQLADQVARAIVAPDSDAAPQLTLPEAALRANRVLAFDSSGNAIVLVGVDSSSATALALGLASGAGATLIGWAQAGTGAATRTVSSKLRDVVSAFDFMTAAQIADVQARTMLLDVTAPLQAALNAAIAGGRALYIPGGTYLLTGVASSDTFLNGLLVPFNLVNADPSEAIIIYGDGGRTKLACNSNNMVLLRIARNFVTVRDITLDSNGRTGVYLCGIVPESMTQTTTLVSQSYVDLVNVNMNGGPSVDGLVIQPGPRVLGADSGCFFHNIIGGASNFIGGGRHVWLKKGSTWATDGNRATRTNFIGRRLLRGNVGYFMEVGSEITLDGCNEELIANGATPLATPTARHVTADCTNISFYGGYSEACSKSVTAFANNISSWGYIPASGSNADWRSYANAMADGTDDNASWTPVVTSSGGGAQGASTSTGRTTKIGKIVFFTAQISAAKGTLAAGNITVSGLPLVADSSWTGADFQGAPCTKMDGITLGTNNVALVGYISGATLTLRKIHGSGASMSNLTVADCGPTIIFTIQGFYKAA
jgi:hypothetical protein